jgi:hypothetical protein
MLCTQLVNCTQHAKCIAKQIHALLQHWQLPGEPLLAAKAAAAAAAATKLQLQLLLEPCHDTPMR